MLNLPSLGPYKQFLSHFRYLLTLRSEQGKYHSLILFRLADSGSLESRLDTLDIANDRDNVLVDHKYKQLYLMESACPHLGADMSHADIEECEDSVVAVCPWHRCVDHRSSLCADAILPRSKI